MSQFRIALIGRSHKNASVAVRDRLSLTEETALEFIKATKAEGSPIGELAVLSTCNRTEFYCVTKEVKKLRQWLASTYEQIKKVKVDDGALPCLILFDENAVRHLLAVASGLESMVLGENQILSQVKASHQLLISSGLQLPVLTRLFQQAIKAGKSVRTDTALCHGAVSISQAAVELARKIFTRFEKRKVLLVGAGETSELVAAHFSNFGVRQFLIANRNKDRALNLTERFGGKVISLQEIPSALKEVDIVVVATNSQNYLITEPQMKKVFFERNQRLLLMLDISTPRNIDPAICEYSEVFVYNIDDLKNVVGANVKKREAEIPKARMIVDQMCREYWEWINSLEITPTIKKLVQRFNEVRETELRKYVNKVSPAEYEHLEKVSRGIMKKLLHFPISSINEMSSSKTLDVSKLDLIYDIYQLHDQEKN